MEKRSLIMAWIVIAACGATVLATALTRLHEGRCSGGGYRGGVDCAHRPVAPRLGR